MIESIEPQVARNRLLPTACVLGALGVLGLGVVAGSLILPAATTATEPEPAPHMASPLAKGDVPLARVRSQGDAEKQRFAWGWLAWLVCADVDADAKTTLGLVHLDPGKSNPVHVHRTCEEVIYVLSGQCEHRVGDRWVVLRRGDALRIPAGTIHAARTLEDQSFEAIVVYNTGRRDFEEVAP